MSEVQKEATVLESTDKKTLCLKIKEFDFSLPVDYSSCSVEELGNYALVHKRICEKVIENNIWSPDKEVVIDSHLNNLKSYVQANRNYCQEVSAALLAKNVEEKYSPILKQINEERKNWNWW